MGDVQHIGGGSSNSETREPNTENYTQRKSRSDVA